MNPIPSLFAAALLLSLSACKEPDAAAPARPATLVQDWVAVATAPDQAREYSGEVRARHEWSAAFRIGGKLVERTVETGERVHAGQVLARLDATDVQLQAQAAATRLQQAEREMARARQLQQQGFISQAALDARESALQGALTEAGVAGHTAAYATLTAERDGVVAEVKAEAGQVVGAGQPVLRLAAAGGREVVIFIPENRHADLKPGMAAGVILWADGDERHFDGTLRSLSAAADASRSFEARVALKSAPDNLPLGLTARVRFLSAAQGQWYLVPAGAVFQQGDRPAVWRIGADNKLTLVPVTVAEWRDDGAWVTAGLNDGDRIVRAGVHKLSAGEAVRLATGAAQ